VFYHQEPFYDFFAPMMMVHTLCYIKRPQSGLVNLCFLLLISKRDYFAMVIHWFILSFSFLFLIIIISIYFSFLVYILGDFSRHFKIDVIRAKRFGMHRVLGRARMTLNQIIERESSVFDVRKKCLISDFWLYSTIFKLVLFFFLSHTLSTGTI